MASFFILLTGLYEIFYNFGDTYKYLSKLLLVFIAIILGVLIFSILRGVFFIIIEHLLVLRLRNA